MTTVVAPITHQRSATLPPSANPVQNQPGGWNDPHLVDPVQLAAVMDIQSANGTKRQGTTGAISPPWPAHQENDVAILLVQLSETDTGATISDPQWQELPGSPVLGTFSGRGVKMHLFGARAFKATMPAPSVSHSGPNIMVEIMLFRGANNGSISGWVAK